MTDGHPSWTSRHNILLLKHQHELLRRSPVEENQPNQFIVTTTKMNSKVQVEHGFRVLERMQKRPPLFWGLLRAFVVGFLISLYFSLMVLHRLDTGGVCQSQVHTDHNVDNNHERQVNTGQNGDVQQSLPEDASQKIKCPTDSHTAEEISDDWETTQTLRKEHLNQACEHIEDHGGLRDFENLTNRNTSGQFLVNQEHQYLYCSLARVASTTLKRALVQISLDVIIPSKTQRSAHMKNMLKKAGIGNLMDFSADEIVHRLMGYKRFMFVRHPIHRIISAFRDMFESETSTSDLLQSLARHILEKYRTKGEINTKVEFKEFVQYLLEEKPYYPKWNSYNQMCRPCFIQYDYIAKVESMDTDTQHTFKAIFGEDLAQRALNDLQKSGPSHNYKIGTYLSQLSCKQLTGLHDLYRDDLNLFHYEEIGTHICQKFKSN